MPAILDASVFAQCSSVGMRLRPHANGVGWQNLRTRITSAGPNTWSACADGNRQIQATGSDPRGLDAIAALTNELYVHGLEVAIVKREGFASASDAAPPPPLPVSDTGGPTAKDCDGVPPPCQSNPPQGI